MQHSVGPSLLVLVSLAVGPLGCNSAPSGPPPAERPSAVSEYDKAHSHSHDDHGHSHGHSHDHPAEGPNGGHLIEFQTEEYHAEWLHDDESGRLTIYILDGSGKQLAPIAAESITIEKKLGDKVDRHTLAAVDPTEDTGKTAKFEITDKPLIEAIKSAGRGIDASLIVDIDGKRFTGKFEHHDHAHGHAH